MCVRDLGQELLFLHSRNQTDAEVACLSGAVTPIEADDVHPSAGGSAHHIGSNAQKLVTSLGGIPPGREDHARFGRRGPRRQIVYVDRYWQVFCVSTHHFCLFLQIGCGVPDLASGIDIGLQHCVVLFLPIVFANIGPVQCQGIGPGEDAPGPLSPSAHIDVPHLRSQVGHGLLSAKAMIGGPSAATCPRSLDELPWLALMARLRDQSFGEVGTIEELSHAELLVHGYHLLIALGVFVRPRIMGRTLFPCRSGVFHLKHLRRTLGELLPLLPPNARRFLLVFAILSAVLSLVDAGALGVFALVLNQVMTNGDGGMRLPLLGPITLSAALIILVSAAGVMILKSLLNIWLQWISTRKFADYELEIGTVLFQSYIRAPWTERMKRSSPELVRMIDVGIANTVSGVLIPAVTLPSQALTFASVLAILIVSSWQTALVTVIYLGLIAAFLYLWLSKKSYEAGRVNRDAAMRMSTLVAEMLAALKEITLRDKADEVGAVVLHSRERAARSRSNIRFMATVPKFVIDMALIGGFLLIGTVSYFIAGAGATGLTAAVSAVAIFALAGFKMVPALTQVQSQLTLVQSTLPYTETVMKDIRDAAEFRKHAEKLGKTPILGSPKLLELRNVEFTYPGSSSAAVHDINLKLSIGTSVGIVGQSGAGKSTLIDIFLGLLTPSKGTMTLDGVPLNDVLADWRRRVGYVPQEVAIFDGTVAQNVALSWGGDIDEDKVRTALARAQLLDTVEARTGGIKGRVGERGLALSGGQRQRLGIARALYMDPLILVLDEATSALDTTTEAAVAKAISELHGEMTVISVAHRLSTIRNNDKICFMKEGSIITQGSFDSVVRSNPDFAQQAALAGLHSASDIAEPRIVTP